MIFWSVILVMLSFGDINGAYDGAYNGAYDDYHDMMIIISTSLRSRKEGGLNEFCGGLTSSQRRSLTQVFLNNCRFDNKVVLA